LIRFSFGILGLQIDDLGNTIPRENVMIALYSFLKFKATKQLTELSKLDVRVSATGENLFPEL